jgi:hypothetical protein
MSCRESSRNSSEQLATPVVNKCGFCIIENQLTWLYALNGDAAWITTRTSIYLQNDGDTLFLIFNDRCWIMLIAIIQIVGSAEKNHMPDQQDPSI